MKIKKALMYFISFLALSAMFSTCYYLSYKNALKQFNENAVQQKNELIASLENKNSTDQNQQVADNSDAQNQNSKSDSNTADHTETIDDENSSDNSSSVVVNAVDEITVLPTTEYTLQTYDAKKSTMEEDKLPTPSYLIGLTRKEVIEYLDDYMKDLTWTEYEKGLVSFELVIFTQDQIVLRKTYNNDLVDNKYYLTSQDGFIVVYYSDKKTVYEYTSVSVENLSQSEQTEIKNGIYVKDLEELYSLLENYSS